MKQRATMGDNRTGAARSEGRTEEMLEGMERFPPTSQGTTAGADKVRILYAKEGHPVGSVPPPVNMKGMAKAAMDKAKGEEPTLLMDKLGERLAFERTGTRLYEALVSKHEAYGSFDGGPTRAELVDILEEEHRHFALLETVMKSMGGDPTAMTPSADIAATVSMGVMKVVTDPRTTLLQSLEAMLVAELADNDCWESLEDLVRRAGKTDIAKEFAAARRTEAEHLVKVRAWLRAGHGRANGHRAAK